MIVLDTSVVIGMTERSHQEPSVLDILENATSDADVGVPEIVLGELSHAVHAAAALSPAAARQLESRQRTLSITRSLPRLAISGDDDVIDNYGRAMTVRPRISSNDAWILALTQYHGATLYTEDADLAAAAATVDVDVVLVTSE